MDLYLRFVLALAGVLALIAGAAWAARRFGLGARLGQGPRAGRRLAVIETMALDAKRKLALVRRDGVEHLLLLGGSADLVIGTAIAASEPAPAPASPVEQVEARIGLET